METINRPLAQYVDNIIEELLNFEIRREEPLTEEQHKEVESRYTKLGYTVKSYYDTEVGKNTIRFID